MTLIRHTGKLLRVGSALARSLKCCCENCCTWPVDVTFTNVAIDQSCIGDVCGIPTDFGYKPTSAGLITTNLTVTLAGFAFFMPSVEDECEPEETCLYHQNGRSGLVSVNSNGDDAFDVDLYDQLDCTGFLFSGTLRMVVFLVFNPQESRFVLFARTVQAPTPNGRLSIFYGHKTIASPQECRQPIVIPNAIADFCCVGQTKYRAVASGGTATIVLS
jgi:hypothetical protein